MSRLRPLLLPTVFAILAGALLVGLGIWQLHRLAWKEAIIARIEARTKAPPQPIPPVDGWHDLVAADYDYRHVALEGTYQRDKEALVFRPSENGPGYLVFTPLALRDGGTVLVDRGFIPDTMKSASARGSSLPEGILHITGLLRPPESRNLFTPTDQPDNGQFFTRDPKTIAAHLGIVDAAPFTVDLDPVPSATTWPHGGATELAIPNNHLSYALTWFGLALGLLGVFLTYAWRRLAEGAERRENTLAADANPS